MTLQSRLCSGRATTPGFLADMHVFEPREDGREFFKPSSSLSLLSSILAWGSSDTNEPEYDRANRFFNRPNRLHSAFNSDSWVLFQHFCNQRIKLIIYLKKSCVFRKKMFFCFFWLGKLTKNFFFQTRSEYWKHM